MKKSNFLFLVVVSVVLLSCGKNDPPPTVEALLKAKVWTLTSTTVDNIETPVYDGLTLRFGSSTYTTTNGGALWKASGTWQFADADKKTIRRDDDLLITVESVNANKLVLSFVWDITTFSGGRGSSIAGQHVMTFDGN